MNAVPSDAQLQAFLDESLPVDQMAMIESALRSDTLLMERLVGLANQRDAGVHSLGEIWRRHRLSCPTRQQLGSYLLRALPDEIASYIHLHLEKVGCRFCQANLDDLKRQRQEDLQKSAQRRERIFQSSAGYFRKK